MPYLSTFDTRQLRNVLGTFTTGVTVVTTRDMQGTLHGVTANSFSSVSLEPPLVLWSQALTSRSFAAFSDCEHFAINILADDQVDLSNHFARTRDDKFAGIPFTEGLGGAPVLQGTVAHFECRKVAAYPAGDHVIYIGQVERVGHTGRRPLAFAHGRYMVPCAHELGPIALQICKAPEASPESVRIAGDALAALQEITGSHTLGLSVWGNHGPTSIRWQPGRQPGSESLRAGVVISITRTSTGRAFAAYLPPEITQPFIDEDLRLYRIADEDENEQRHRFEQEIATVRQHGVAKSAAAESSALGAVSLYAYSAPVFDLGDDLIMVLTLTGANPSHDDRLPGQLLAAARQLTLQIGGRPASCHT